MTFIRSKRDLGTSDSTSFWSMALFLLILGKAELALPQNNNYNISETIDFFFHDLKFSIDKHCEIPCNHNRYLTQLIQSRTVSTREGNRRNNMTRNYVCYVWRYVHLM